MKGFMLPWDTSVVVIFAITGCAEFK